MDFRLTEEQQLLRQSVREFAEREIRPHVREWDEAQHFPRELVPELAALGLMEGPQFSTLAESNLYRSWGMDIIGMTNLQEAKLAREAEICYTTIALVTDYDCWHPDHDSVTVDMREGTKAFLEKRKAEFKGK